MRNVLCILACILSSYSSMLGQAQPIAGTISGTVTNSDDGSGIAGALGSRAGGSATALTGSAGEFVLESVPIPTRNSWYTVTASRAGFGTASASVVLSPAAPNAVANITLADSAVSVGPGPEGDLSVSVSRDGAAQPGAVVSVFDLSGGAVGTTLTGSQGVALFQGLNGARYIVAALLTIGGVDFRGEGEAEVLDGQTTFLRIGLPSVDQSELDSLAVWSTPMEPEFYQQLDAWIPSLPDKGVVATGRSQILTLDSLGMDPERIEAQPGEELTSAPDGLHYGRMQNLQELVGGFRLFSLQGDTLWSHDFRGHYYYVIGPGATTVVGKTADGLPGSRSSRGDIVGYDTGGNEVARPVECQTPSLVRFSGDGSIVLVQCRDADLKMIDANGAVVDSAEGHFRSFSPSSTGTYFVAVERTVPNTVFIVRPSEGTRDLLNLGSLITEVAIAPGDGLVVVAVGKGVAGIEATTGNVAWRHEITGPSPRVVSMSLGSGGLAALGILFDSSGEGRDYPAAVEILRDESLLKRIDFKVRDPDVRIPKVWLNSATERLLVYDDKKVWYFDFEALQLNN